MTRASAPKRPIAAGLLTLAALSFDALAFDAPARAASDLEAAPPDGADLGTTAPEREDSDHWTLGVGAAVAPRFQGSDEFQVQPLPLVDVKYGRFFARLGDGVGVNVIETPTIAAGVALDWMWGYDGDDVPDGIDGVDGALGVRVFLSVRYEGAVATLAATQAVTDTDRGLVVNASLAYPLSVTERLTITPSLGTSWANETYMDGYFGVDASEAAASGLGQYKPASGFKDVSFLASARYRITDSIAVVGSVGVTHLLGEAADSPIVERKTQPIGLLGLTYTF